VTNLRKLIAGLVIGGVVACALLFIGLQLPVWQWMAAAVDGLRAGGPLAIGAFAMAHISAIVLFVPASPFVFAAGMVWGTLPGTLLVTFANLVGPSIAFLLAQRTLRPTVQRHIAGNRHAEAIDAAMVMGGFRAIVLLRLSPIVPMSILNYGLGLFDVPLRDYTIATAVGLLPITVLYCWGGSGIGEASGLAKGEFSGPLHQAIFWLGLAATFVAVWYLERLARKAIAAADDARTSRNARGGQQSEERQASLGADDRP